MSSVETYTLLKGKDNIRIEVLYERYGKKLFSYAIHSWKLNEDEAWDLVYKTLFRILEVGHRYEFDSEKNFSSFVFRVFVNYLRNHYRDKKNSGRPLNVEWTDEEILEEQEAGETEIIPNPKLDILNEELEKLEDWQRILLLMRSQDIPNAVISKYAGKPEDQLPVYYQRLKTTLTQRMLERMETLNEKENGK